MSFPNQDWQEEQDVPRWRAVDGKPNTYVHDEHVNGCEAEIYRVECADCGNHAVVCHAVCGCDDHRSDLAVEELRKIHETCDGCGHRMTRLETPEDGSWPKTTAEKEAEELERAAAEEVERAAHAGGAGGGERRGAAPTGQPGGDHRSDGKGQGAGRG